MTAIHRRHLQPMTEGLVGLAKRMLRLEQPASVRADLRRLLSVRVNGTTPLTDLELRYSAPFIWDRLKALQERDLFWELLEPEIETHTDTVAEALDRSEHESNEARSGVPPELEVVAAADDLPSNNPSSHERLLDYKLKIQRHSESVELLTAQEVEIHKTLVPKLTDDMFESMARRFVVSLFREMEGLPYRYTGIVRLPFGSESSEVLDIVRELTPRTFISLATEEMDEWFSELVIADHASERQSEWATELYDDTYYFCIEVAGYKRALPRVDDPIVVDIRDPLKALIGLCLASDLLEFVEPLEHEEPIVIAGAGNAKSAVVFFPEDEAAVYGSLSVPVLSESAMAGAKRTLHAISAAFRANDERLLSAGRWFFGSFCGSNELLRLVQATTTLEILLGDQKESEKVGIGELLASRGAYLVATSRVERESLLKQFKSVYDTRSKAVHSGVNNLNKDIDHLATALTLCKRVIQKELAVLTLT